MQKHLTKCVNKYIKKISDCDEIINELQGKKKELRAQRRSDNDVESLKAEQKLRRVLREESFREIQRLCYVEAMHVFDDLLDLPRGK